MNKADIALIIILIFQFLFGFKNGIFQELLKLVMLIIAVVLAYFLTPLMVSKLAGVFDVSGAESYLEGSFLAVFLLLSCSTLITGRIFVFFVSIFTRLGGKNSVSRLLGGVLSTLRTCILCGGAMIFITLVVPDKEISTEIKESKVAVFPVTVYNHTYGIVKGFIDDKGITLDDILKNVQ